MKLDMTNDGDIHERGRLMARYPVGYGGFGERLRASKRVVAFLACGALALLACGSAAAAPAPLGAFTEFTIPTANSGPLGIAAGADGNLWFTETNGDKIGRITPTGTITEFTIPTANSTPFEIAAGADGNLWFTENNGNKIGRITPTGTITEFTIPTANSRPLGIAAGADGNVWFTENNGNQIGRITPTGAFTEFMIPTADSFPVGGIAAGADGNVWFTEGVGKKIGRISPTGTITEFTIPTANSGPLGIAAGADGNLWFTENSGNKVGLVGAGAAAASVRAPSVTGSGQQGTQQVCQGDEWAQWAGEPPSFSAVAFDGYQWLRDGRPIAGQTSQAYTPSTGDVGQQLSCTVTVTYPLLNVTVSATSTAVTVIPQASGPQGQTGLQGLTGRQGPTGKQGLAGKVELVKCKAVKRKHKTKQVCTTRLLTGPVKFTTAAADERAALSHHGVIYATGYARQTHAGVQTWLLAARRLAHGRYTLALTTRRGSRQITTRTQVTIA
jgi:streptogramin lyase